MLDTPCRRDVCFFVVFDQLECPATFTAYGIRVVLRYWKTAALGGPVGSEGGNDHVAARLDRPHYLIDIRAAVGIVCEEVELLPSRRVKSCHPN
ncbi:hypothetical protein [Paraburkholderia sediminicola]|uniref:hypothetical protein n=1 Tax=Paraburkholderia sediminicola TaxID=458836 RepID=UPI0038B93B1F